MGLAMLGAVSQGILWGVMVLGVFITYKLLDIADLTVDGSFALGGSVCAVLVVSGVDPVLAIFAAMLAGMIAGAVTGFLHTVFEIPAILAGILTQIALWSVTDATGLPQNVASIIVGLIFAILIIVALYWFFGTEIGSACRATGNNEAMVRALGVDTKVTKMIALTLSNGLVGLSGGLICESQGYADIGMGTGAIVIGLAAIVIGEVLGRLTPGKLRSFGSRLTAAVVGSVVYFLIRAIVLQLGMDANDMKLISAVIVALALCIPVVWEKYQLRRAYARSAKAAPATPAANSEGGR